MINLLVLVDFSIISISICINYRQQLKKNHTQFSYKKITHLWLCSVERSLECFSSLFVVLAFFSLMEEGAGNVRGTALSVHLWVQRNLTFFFILSIKKAILEYDRLD